LLRSPDDCQNPPN